ncbi:MAG: peptidylprolyl isomerase [Hyphomicrobium sp.]|jgi:peptidyl-prolyl cis-trans isomerase SurA
MRVLKRALIPVLASLAMLGGALVGAASVEAQSVSSAAPAAKPSKPVKKAAAAQASISAEGADAATSTTGKSAQGKGGASPAGGQSIAVLINDEPITGYEIEQRAAFIALQSGQGGADLKAKAEARWKQIIKDPSTNERFKELLKKNNVRSQEEARALQTKFVKELQQNMLEQLRREARVGAVAGSRTKAQTELIDERLKLQAAKSLNISVDEPEVERILTGMAERNKLTLDQFGTHMKSLGVDINTIRGKFKAEMVWREVIRRRFGFQVSITERDVDRFVANAPKSDDEVELQVSRITLPLPAKADQQVIGRRIGEANTLAGSFSGCPSMSSMAVSLAGARFEDLGTRKPSTIPEPTRSLLLNATEGELLPPSVSGGGVELWALCSRKVLKADKAQRENAENELRQKEFEVLAQKLLKDLRQDAAIEYR